ncbi:polycystin-1 isoform X3 [Polyodon spathula]|uniref:polycystin-1 isoform X3 n=1 Tax=Polyodon spathula TaxID=7913 RepID=UPI001B7F44B2|nr:polycystin-1 isoform X3 [Polyodon spathula]
MPYSNGQTVSKRKHGVYFSKFGLFSSLLFFLCFFCISGSGEAQERCAPCPDNCTCSVLGPQLSCLVNCSNTGLHQGPDAMDIPCDTAILDLSQNRFSSIDASLFQRLTSLKELYLQGNNISVLPHGIFSCGILSILDLSNNQISTLEEGMFHNLFNLSEINLSLNPFVCDCKLLQLISWIAEQGVVVHHAQSTKCAKPPEVENLPLLSVNVSSITCGLSYAACLLDKHTGRKELVIFSSLTPGNFTRNSCNALCFSTHQPYGGLGTKNECLCGTNFEPNLISESQCSAACSNHLVMRDCRWTVAQQAFIVEFTAYFTQLGTFSIHEEAKLNISISVSVSTLLWDFGDQTPLLNTTKSSASHKYAIPGKYRVNVTLFAGADVTSIQTEVNVIIPPRLELKCPAAVTANDSIDIGIAEWDGTNGTVDWNIVSESGEIGKAPFCPSDGLLHIGSLRCYQLIRSNSTWQEARQFCASHGNGDLATVTNQDVKNLLITLIGNERDAWIGLWYTESDRSLKWVDGSAAGDLETLLTSEPASGSENTCLTMDSSGQWNPKLCSTRAASICEYRHQPQVAEKIPDADYFLEGSAAFNESAPLRTITRLASLSAPARSVELLVFPGLWFRQKGTLAALEFVTQALNSTVQIRLQVYRPSCDRLGLNLVLPGCGEHCVPTAVCQTEAASNMTGVCPARYQWCPFTADCLPVSHACHSSLCTACPAPFVYGRSQPEHSLVHELLFTLLPAVSTHYLAHSWSENIQVYPGDFIAVQHDGEPGSLINCRQDTMSPWKQNYFRVNHSDWITGSLDNTTLRNWTEEAVCSLRVLYTQKKVKFIESPLLKVGLTTPGMYSFHAAVESKPFSRNLSCTFQVVPPLGLTIVYPPVQDDIIYFPTNKTFLLLKITSWHNATARWHGNNQSFPFQTICPEEIASLIEDCKMNSSGALFSRIDLELNNASVVSVVITADNELSSENQTVKVKTEDPVRGLRIVPDPHHRVLVKSLVSYTAVVDSGSDVTFKWTVDDKPSFTYYNTVLNVIYQNPAIYKLSVTALNHVSSLMAEFNVTVDRMNMMADLRVVGVPAVVPQSSSETLTASIKVDTAVDATFQWTFGDGGHTTYHFKPPYDISLQVQDTSVNQALLQHNVTYTYQQPGEYTLTVSVSNKYENISQLIQVFVYSHLTSVGIIVDTEALVVGSTAAFEAHPLPSPYGIMYTWSFGDGSSPVQGRERRVNHTFNQSGVYNISVRANNTISSTDSQRSVLVFEAITGLSASSNGPTELHTAVLIHAEVKTGNNISWIFDMGDGSQLTNVGPVVEYTYVKEAIYTVNVTAINAISIASVSLAVQVFVLEVLRLEPSKCIQELVNISFIAFVSGNSSVYVYDWNFGDGSPNLTVKGSPEANHLFRRSGVYALSLGLSSSVNKANFFTSICVQPVVMNVTIVPLSKYTKLGEESRFYVSAFPEYQYNYLWDFGTNDSAVRGTNEMGFTYRNAGQYSVTVSVLNNISFSSSMVQIEVQESVGLVIITHNGTKSNNLALQETYMFRASGSYWKERYTWDFGDGSNKLGCNVTHAYNSTGNFNITLTGWNEVSSNTSQISVAVKTPVRGLTVTASKTIVPLNASVTFMAHLLAGDDLHYSWILCDRCTPIPRSSTIFYTFRSIGTFNIIVTAENEISSMQASIFIFVLKEIEGLHIVAEDLVDGCCFATNRVLHMQAAIRDGTNMSYIWTVLKAQDPILNFSGKLLDVNFPEPGFYDVILKATNLLGTSSVNRTIEFLDPIGNIFMTAVPNPVAVNHSTNISLLVSSGTDLKYIWSTEDHFTSPTEESWITHQFSTPGLKQVGVMITNKVSSKNVATLISVQEPISGVNFFAQDLPDQYYIASGSTVSLQGEFQRGTNVTWTWHLPNSTATEQQITLLFAVSGIYTISLNASNDISWALASRNITVQDKIGGLELKASKNIASLRENVLFMIGISSGTSVSFLLSISGDSSVFVVNLNYTHQFTKVGDFVVNLTAQNQVSTERTSIIVTVMEPVSRLRIVNCCEEAIPTGVSKMFNAETLTGSPVTYLWTFDLHCGSKKTIIGKQVSYTPPQAGQLTIYLSAFNALGSQNITRVIQAQNKLLLATLEAKPAETLVNKPVTMQALVSPHPTSVNYVWSFGDGSEKRTTKTANVSHAYLVPGEYTVEVNASNLVSFAVAQTTVTIQVLECEEPEVQPVQSSPTVIRRSQRNYLEVAVDFRGCTRYKIEYLWEIYRTTTCSNSNDNSKVSLHDVDVQRPQLVIPRMALDLGSYCVIFSLSYADVPLRKSIAIHLNVVPSKLVPIIDGGTFRVWSKTQDLLMNGEKSYDPNLEPDNQSPLSYTWTCVISSKTPSSGCNLKCGSQEKVLVIAEDMLEADVVYTFLLTVSKAGMSPENTTQTVLVKNGTVPMVSLECISCKAQSVYEVSQSSYVYLAGTCNNCQDNNSHSGRWRAQNSKNESLVLDVTTTSTGSTGMNLVVRQGILKDGDAYTFSLHVTDPFMENEGFASIELRPNLPPAGGFCVLHPSDRANALTTKVQFKCTGYKDSEDSETPLLYSLIVTRCNIEHCEDFCVYKGTNAEYSAFLPLGFRASRFRVDVSVTVQDQQGAAIVALNQSMVIHLPDPPEQFQSLTHWLYNQTETALEDLIKQKDPRQVREYALALITVLNEFEQIGPPSLDSQSEQDFRILIRSKVTLALISLEVNTVDDIQQTSAALAQCTAVSREFICRECQRQTLTKLESMLAILQSDTRQGTVTPTKLADNILNIMGDLIHLVNQPPPQPTTDDSSNDQHPLLVASKAYNLSSELMRILMHSRVLNEEPLVLHGTEITTQGKRAHPLNLLCFPDGPLCPFSIPKEFNSTFRDMTGIVQVMFQVDSNPFPFGYIGNYTVSTEVASMEFQTANGTQIPISSLGASKAITVMVSNSTGVKENSSWTEVVSEWSSVIVLVTTGNTNKAVGLHIQVMFTVLNDGAAASEEEPYITAYLHSYLNPNEYNCTAQKRITLSMAKGPDHRPYTFFISPDVFDTTKDYYLNVTNGCWRSPVQVEVGVYTSLCQYFNNQEMRWKTDGMVPLESTTPDKAVCLTEHLTAFGASLFVPPDAVRFLIPAPSPGMNYIVLLTCAVCFVTYSVVAVIVRKLDLIDINRAGVIPFCGKDGLYKYEIQVKTGWGRGSGTTAHVGISLYGTDSKSGHRHLDGWNAFLRNSLDIFHMSTDSSLGSILKIRVWHDNKGLSPSWYLQYVIVKDLQTSKKYFFLINDWLSVDNDDNDGMVEKEVTAATNAELRQVSRIFVAELERGLSEKHIWLSLWERPARSRFTRVQRATCCTVLIYLFILANAVWYGLVGDKTRSYVPVSNLMPVNLETVAVGMVTCVIVYPVYLIVLTLFRMARSKASVKPPVAQLEQQSLEIDDYLDSSTIGNSFLTFNGVSGETYSEEINSDISVAASKSLQKSNSQERVVPHWPDLLNDPSIIANNLPKLKRGQGSRHLGVDMALVSEEEDFYINRNKYFTASDEDLIKKILADGHRQASRLRESQLYLSHTETELADLSTIFGDKTEVILLQQLNEPGPTGTGRRDPPRSAHISTGTTRRDLPRSAHTSRTAVMDASAPRLFPHWCSHAAHVLSFLLLAGSIGISVWIGMGFGSSVALMWLLSGIFSFLASFFVLEPLKVLLEALYFALIAKRILPEERDTLVENPQVQHVSEKIQRVRAPQGFALFQAKEEAKKVRKLHRMLKSFLVYMFFLLVVLITSYEDSFRDTNARHLQSLVHQRLDTTEFISIEKPEEFWIWLSHVLLPYLYSNETMRETNNILLGVPRLRQIRMQNGCPISNYLEPSLAERDCIQFAPIVDTRSYGLGWGSQNLNQSNTWTYFPPDLTGVWYWGKLSIYNSGGYVKELKRTMNDSNTTLLDLQRNNWLDRMTSAVFVEFTLYNTNTDLYAAVALLVEFAAPSSAYTSMHIKAVPLLRLSTGADLLLVMMGFLVMFVVYFVVHETLIMKKERSSYFSQPWNLVQWSVIVLTLAAVVVHLNRISIADKQWHTFLNHRDGFTNFYQIAFLSYAFTNLAAVVLFLLILKAAVQLRFLRDWSVFGKTLCRSVRELLAAGVALTLLLLAYSHLGYLVFSSSMEGYSSFGSSVLSLLSTLRGLGSLKACLPEQRSAVCYVFYISYTVIDMWIILRIFAVVLIRNYTVVRFEMYRPAIEPQDYEMMELFLRRLKMWMGISKTKEFRHKVRFEGMEPLPSRASTDSKSLFLPTPDSASDISSNSTTSSQADSFHPVMSREQAEAEAALHRLLPVFETLLLQLDRVNKVTEDVYQAECRLEHIQTKINKKKYVQMTQILLKYCTTSKSSSAGKSSSNHLDHKSKPRKGKARPLDPDWTKRSKGASLVEETTVGTQMPNAPSSLFRHPAHTTTVPVKKRKPAAMKNKVHPNTDSHVSSHLKS